MKKISKAAYQVEGQPMFKVLAHVLDLEKQGKDIIHFEIGDPDYDTPLNIKEAACAAIMKGETHYTSSSGITDMRLAVCDTTEFSRGFRPKIEQVLVTPGANIIIYYAIRCLVDPGEEVILPDPGFPTYLSAIKFCGVKPVFVPLKEENEFRMNPEDIRNSVTDKTRLIIINSPQNPTGAIMTPEELNDIYDIAEEQDIYLYCDEVYARMVYDEKTNFYSPSKRDRCLKQTIVANGFSKAFAMTGWRLGCAIGPEIVIEKMGLLLQTTSSCVSPFIQRAGIEAIRGSQDAVKGMMQEYKERRDLLVNGLNELPGVKCLSPGGAFYVFPNITKTGMDDEIFAKRMLEDARVALLPGSNFGEYGKGFVRLCYANSKENIKEGLTRMRSIL